MDTRTPSQFRQTFDRFQYDRFGPRGRLFFGIAVVVGVLLLGWYFVHRNAGPKGSPPAPVHVATVHRQNVDIVEHTIGTVLAESTVNITAQVSGQLMVADFKEGQIVHKSDLLFQIDPRPFQDALDQAQAALARDQANLVNAQNDERRFVALFAQNAASQSQRDQAVATSKADAAVVQADEALVKVAKLNLEYTQIRSPVDGKTGPILIQPGNLVTAGGSNPLVTITQIQPVKVSCFLPQSDLAQIQNQMSRGLLKAVIPMEGAAGGSEVAPVNFIGNAVSAQTGTIELRATFANDDLRLVPGQMVSVGVTMKNLTNVLVVLRNAVNAGPQGSFVYVVDAESKAQLVPVTVLNDDGTNDAVAGKLKPGARAITEGQLRLVPGTKVEIIRGSVLTSPTQASPGAQ